MFVDILLLIVGFFLLIKGADIMVDGSASIAKKFGLSSLMIGLTVIAFGTSAPELIVNVLASINGNSDIGMGNIVGSNITNILLILGVSALFADLKVHGSIIKKQIPFSILAAVVLFILINSTMINGLGDNGLFRSGGLILIAFFSIFLYYTFSIAKNKSEEDESEEVKAYTNCKSILMILGGILALFVGGRFIVNSAVNISHLFGLSEAFIGLTVVAIGTSLPELAASVVAARKNQAGMAVGNIVGSNIFNILWILGLSAIISPIAFNPIMNFDIIFMICVSMLLIPLVYMGKKNHFTKKEGIILLLLYSAYMAFVIIRA
ncbi:MAG: calcium/sodium antiporter [Patescibacteria group bacterium]